MSGHSYFVRAKNKMAWNICKGLKSHNGLGIQRNFWVIQSSHHPQDSHLQEKDEKGLPKGLFFFPHKRKTEIMLGGNNQTCSRNIEENIKGTVPIFKDPFTVWTDHHYNIMVVLLYALSLYLDNSLLMFPFVPNFGLPQRTLGIPVFIIV